MDITTSSPICTFPEVARIVDMPENTLRSWARPTKSRPPLVHTVPNARRGWPTIPLAGLVEAWSLHALRDMTSMQKITPVVARLRERTGDAYILAKPKLFVDTAGELYELESDLFIRIRDQQAQMPKIFDHYMRAVDLDDNDNPRRFKLTLGADDAILYIDPRLNAGRPSFRNGVPAFAVLGAIEAGDSVHDVAEDFDLSQADIKRILDDREELAAFA